MTIKEIEALSEMTRANIRFYETEGLLTPARGPNGYRDYSDNDLEILKRIRLLRSLHVSLEEIKKLHREEDNLLSVLERHITALDAKRKEIDTSQRVCREICNDGASYQTLNTQKYLNSLNRPAEPTYYETLHAILTSDVIPPVSAPWRRLFARSFDMILYSVAWNIFLLLVCNINIAKYAAQNQLPDLIVTTLLMLLVEPLMLRLFGTTPGKWILGLHVTDNDDRRLSYSAAFKRTWTVLWRGRGLGLPVYSLIRLWKSYQACDFGETLEWEYDSTLVLRDEKKWRYAALAGAHAVLFGLLLLSLSTAEMPRHRGDITPAEFCDNYNRLADYYDGDFNYTLDENGKWIKKQDPSYAYIVYLNGKINPPNFTFTETDGLVTGVSFHFATTDNTLWPPSFEDQMTYSAMSFACTQKDFGVFSKGRNDLLSLIQSHPFQDFHFNQNGITVDCDVEYSGYTEAVSPCFLVPNDGAKTSYSLRFSMSKSE